MNRLLRSALVRRLLGLCGVRAGDALAARLIRGFGWTGIGGVASRACLLAGTYILSRLLGAEEFGRFGLIQGAVGTFAVFAAAGLGVTAAHYVASLYRTEADRAGRIIALARITTWGTSLLIATLMFVSARWLSETAFQDATLEVPLRIAAINVFLLGIVAAQNGILSGFEAFKTLAAIAFLNNVVTAFGMAAGAALGGLTGAVGGGLAGTLTAFVLGWQRCKRECFMCGVPQTFKFERADMRVLWTYTAPAILAVIVVQPVQLWCSSIIYRQTGGAVQMAFFSAANQWFLALMFLPSLMGQALLPMLSGQTGADGPRDRRRIFAAAIKLCAVTVMPALLVIALGRTIMAGYGPGFEGAALVLDICAITAVVLAIQTPVGQVILASGNIWPGFLMNLGWAAVFVGLTVLFRDSGAVGLAKARLIAYLIHAVWTMGYALLILRVPRRK